MSGDAGLDIAHEQPSRRGPGSRRAQRKRRPWGCLVLVVVAAVLLGGSYVGITRGADAVSGWINGPEDFKGQGTGEVVVEVQEGDTVAAVGRTLKAEGVVASVDAFLAEANANDAAQQLQPGFYRLREKMSAQWAVTEITDPANRVEGRVAVPEGSRADQVLAAIEEGTDVTAEQLQQALRDPQSLGLPEEARGDVEGYLFPATYTFGPDVTATEALSTMIAKSVEVEQELDLDGRAQALGISKEEAVIVASLIEREASREEDRPRVARVIYNRLEEGMPLQLDSTVAYVSEREGDVFTTDEERNSDSPYNTYRNAGLPPGPIASPGQAALDAALNPADGDWLYFVTVDLESGETEFAESYQDHLRNVEDLRRYCRGSDLC